MTPSDAAGLALLALHDRRLVSAIVRTWSGRATADDVDALPPRAPDESVLAWACRSRARSAASAAWRGELARWRGEGDAQLARAAERNIVAIPLGDARYPTRLAAIPDPPLVLWLRGQVAVLHEPGIAIVGSRAATPYALSMAARIALDLAAAGFVVVSGLARGVDSAAHAAAISARGCTVGILGCGVDRIYPAEHKDLAKEMAMSGAVVSEFPPGVPPRPHHFPARNRIISGVSLGVVVVEAPEKSGALITASAAAEQGRDVMVVPGPVPGGRNRGGHLLIRDGARIVETAEDVLQELNLTPRRAGGASAVLADAPVAFTVDEVAARTGDLPNVVLAQLLELELAGKIQRVGGGRFVRVLT